MTNDIAAPGKPIVDSRLDSRQMKGVAAVALILVLALPAAGAVPAKDPSAVERLRRSAGGGSKVSLNRATGTVSFLQVGRPLALKSSAGETPHARTMAFLEAHGSAFGLEDPETEVQLLDTSTDRIGHTHVRYRQVYRGVPVFASDLRSHFDRNGSLVTVSAMTVPIGELDPVAEIPRTRAAAIAVAAVEDSLPPSRVKVLLEPLDPKLVIFRTGLLQGVAGRNHLAYHIEVVDRTRRVREFVFVDAQRGTVLDRITGIHHGLDREMYTSALGAENLVWSEGDALPFVGDDAAAINNLIAYTEDSYNFFLTLSGGTHPSFDAADAALLSVFDDEALFCSLAPNASWNGINTGFCDGTTADDVVAHEWAHAYTEYNHGLIYQWQPGALNESYSDIFGEVVDWLNGEGSDAPSSARSSDGTGCSAYDPVTPGSDDSLRWLEGEDAVAFGGAIRDMWRPECQGDPGRVSSDSYFCSTDDGGGVHTNSGVPNHAFALLVDGGTFNGQTISGIGPIRAAHIYWYAMTAYQGPATDFAAHADALEASCAALVGADLPAPSTDTPTPTSSGLSITAGHCAELAKVILATELRSEPTQCDFKPIFAPDPPQLCAGLGAKLSISSTDWETGLGAWIAGTRDVVDPLTFDTPDWGAVDGLPDGRVGTAAFVANIFGGDCVSDIEAGVLTLESPDIEVPAGVHVLRVAIDQWLATEALQDGGNLKLSVNGGPFDLVPKSAFEVGPYNDILALLVVTPDLEIVESDNPLRGEDAFTGTDGGVVSGSWGASHISLYGLAGSGDTIRLRFEFGIDGCNGLTGWYVDEVEVYSCADELPPSECGNGSLDAGEVCDDGNSVNDDGCTNTCQIEQGWLCTPPLASGTIEDPSFEAGYPSSVWTIASDAGLPVICSYGTCLADVAHDGDWYAWFGGVLLDVEESTLSQDITIAEGNTSLGFHLMIDACDSAADYLEVLIDGQQVWSVTGASPLCGNTSWSFQSVDLTGYNDGENHALTFHCETFAQNILYSNFFVDLLSLTGQPSVCTVDPDFIFGDGFEDGDLSRWTASVP